MKLSRVLLASFALALPTYAAAFADTVSFTFSFGTSSSPFQGSGTLTGSTVASSIPDVPEFLITSVTGTTRTTANNNLSISGIEQPGTFGSVAGTNDNLLFETSPGVFVFDASGLSYLLSNSAQVNLSGGLFGTGSEAELLMRTGGNQVTENLPFTITATPEPGSFVLLGTGLLGVVGAARRRFAV